MTAEPMVTINYAREYTARIVERWDGIEVPVRFDLDEPGADLENYVWVNYPEPTVSDQDSMDDDSFTYYVELVGNPILKAFREAVQHWDTSEDADGPDPVAVWNHYAEEGNFGFYFTESHRQEALDTFKLFMS